MRAFQTFMRGLCIFCNVTNFMSPPHSRDPRRTKPCFLKGLCLENSHGSLFFIMSQDGTPQCVPLYLESVFNDVIKKVAPSSCTARKSFDRGQGDSDTFSPRSLLQPQHLICIVTSPHSPMHMHTTNTCPS